MTSNNLGRALSVAGVALLLTTLGIAVQRVWQKANTAKAQRERQIQRNGRLITELNKFLPDKRTKLKPNLIKARNDFW